MEVSFLRWPISAVHFHSVRYRVLYQRLVQKPIANTMKVYIQCTKTYNRHYISVHVHFLCTPYNNRHYVSVHVHFLCTLYTNRHYVSVHVHFLCTSYNNKHYVYVHLCTLHLDAIKPSTDMQIMLMTVLLSWGEVYTNVQKQNVCRCTVYT